MPMPLHVPWGPDAGSHLGPSRREAPHPSYFVAAVLSVERHRMETRLVVASAGREMVLAVHWLDALMIRFEIGSTLTLAASPRGLDLVDIRVAGRAGDDADRSWGDGRAR